MMRHHMMGHDGGEVIDAMERLFATAYDKWQANRRWPDRPCRPPQPPRAANRASGASKVGNHRWTQMNTDRVRGDARDDRRLPL